MIVYGGDVTTVCTSRITDMSECLVDRSFNQDISAWDVSNVTNMSLCLAMHSFNQDLSAWDVSNVTTMSDMFNEAPSTKTSALGM